MISILDLRRIRLMSGAAALALTIGIAGSAFAQSAESAADGASPADDGELVVTGFRASIATAIGTKRESDQIVESISAEDIGKLPDTSIAESIARLPGLTTQRLDGRAQVISIRGLSPDFATTLLNGREQVTTGDNRGVEFDQYPSELVGGVDIYKTPFAGLVGQGLSGSVNLKTIRPLAYGRQAFSVNARGEKVSLGKLNSGSNDTGYRLSGTYIDQFAGDTIGVMLGVAYMNSPSQVEKFNAWGYPETAAGGPLVLGGVKPFVQSSELKRLGLIGSLEYEPNENFNTRIDAYYSKFKDKQNLRGIEIPLWWSGSQLQPGFTVDDGLITDGTFGHVKGVVRNDMNTRDADLYSIGWNAEYNSDRWTFIGDISYSRVDRKDSFLETWSGTSRGDSNGPFDTIGFALQPNGTYKFTPTVNYADPNVIVLTSPQGWGSGVVPGGQDGYLNMPSTKDELASFRASANYELGGGLKALEFGINFTTRDKDYTPDEFFIGLIANANDPAHNTSVPIPSNLLLKPTKLKFLGIPGMVSYDPQKLLDSGIYNLIRNPNDDVATKSWEVSEDIWTGWLRLDIDAPLADGSLTGNIGVQVVHTDQSSDGIGDTSVPITDGAKYTEVLPSVNLSFRFTDNDVLRIGAARTLARPRMDQMKASINFSTNPGLVNSTDPNNSFFSGNGGNPKLKPWIADSFDASYEHYFAPDAYLAAAAFYKHLESYIFEQDRIRDFTGFPTNLPAGQVPATFLGRVRTPVNGDGGKIYGFELSGALPFSLFSEALDGFGLLGSYSYTKSNIQPNPDDEGQPLPGLSKHVTNLTAYFEKYGFSARASLRSRSKFLAEVVGFGVGRVNRMAKGETVVDAQIGYEFQDGPLKGLGILLQGQNLTNEPFVTYQNDDTRQVIDHQNFGRRYLLGVSYKFGE